jgi:hypothetical protein
MFCWKKSKTTFEICVISKHGLWFSITNTSSCSYYYLKLLISSFPLSPLFSKILPFWTIPNHIIMILTTRIQINKVPLSIFIIIVLFIQNHIFILPPQQLHSKNAWQSFENSLAHSKCVNNLWLRCNVEKSLCLQRSLMNSKVCTLTPWP